MRSYKNYHKEHKSGSRTVIIDIAKDGKIYEVMALDAKTGEDLKSMRTEREDDAIDAFRRYCQDFPECSPLTGKYAKLRDDLRQALEAGRDAERANPEDGGACNFDAASIFLPRWNSSKVEQAAREAGTGCFDWYLFGGRRYVFSPNSRAQGNARSRNAEAMTKALRDMGYEAMDYSQMD